MFSSTRSKVIAAAVTAGVIAGGSYGIVTATSSSASATASSTTPSAAPSGSASGGGSNARSGPAAGGSSGTASSVTSSGFTLTTAAGEKVTVKEEPPRSSRLSRRPRHHQTSTAVARRPGPLPTGISCADILQIPLHGPYVVITAHVPGVGRHALPQAEAALQSIGVASAWRLLHDVEVGIAWLPSPQAHLGHLVDVLQSISTGCVGISPPHEDLRHTAQSLRLASSGGSDG